MNFIQFRPLVTECLTFVAAGPGSGWLVRKVRRVFLTRWNYPMSADGSRNSVTMEWSFCFISPRLSDVSTLECCGMRYNGQCLGPDGSAIGYWVNTTHHTPGGDQEMKTSRQKRPRMCQLDFLWVFPTKIWFYVHCGPAGERVTESVVCGWSVGRQAGCDHVRPGVSVLYWPDQPPAGLPALSIAILQPDSSAYSPSEWSLALLSFRENKLSNVPWAER